MDNAATTRMRPEVLEAMMPYLTDRYGNPSSIHEEGRRARQAIDKAREQVKKALGARPEDYVYFTSGATEANNIVLNTCFDNYFLFTGTEHPSVLNYPRAYSVYGQDCVDTVDGIIDPVRLAMRLDKIRNEKLDEEIFDGFLFSFPLANNETGTLQNMSVLDNVLDKSELKRIRLHVDATQAVGHIPIRLNEWKSRYYATFSAHKFGGPKGVGAIVTPLKLSDVDSVLSGGHQEDGVRPGTENVAGIVGLGKAIELAVQNLDEKKAYVSSLSRKLCDGILSDIESAWLNGPPVGMYRLPGNVNISFAGCRGEAIVLALDEAGVAVSSGSACSSGSGEPSPVLMQMYNDKARANASVRFSLDENNTMEEVDYVLSILPGIVERVRDNEDH